MCRKTKIISFILFVLGVVIFSVQTKAMDAYEIYEKAVQNTIQSGSWTEYATDVIDINYTDGNTQGTEKGNVLEYSLDISNYSRENPREAIISGHGKVNILGENFNFEYQYENGISHTITDSDEYGDNPQEEPTLFDFDIFTQDMFENANINNTELEFVIPANKAKETFFKNHSADFEKWGYGNTIADYGDVTVKISIDEYTKAINRILVLFQGAFDIDGIHIVADYELNYEFSKIDYNNENSKQEDIEQQNGLIIYSDYDTLSVRKDSSISLGACSVEKGEILNDVSGITFIIEDTSILSICDTGISAGKRFVKLIGKKEGTTLVTFSDSKTGFITQIPITVYNNNYLSYTLNSVPIENIEKYPTNFYNVNGLYMDNYSYIVNADKSATVSFDIYNTNYTYGVVEVYKKDGKLQNCVLIKKMEKNNTSIKKAVWDNSKCLISDLVNGNLLTYRQESMYSKKTSITVDIPEGGYIKISNDSSTPLVAIINDVDMLISIGKLKKTIEGNNVDNEEFLEQLTGKILKEKTYATIIENKDEVTKKLWKNVSEKVYYSPKSLGSFSQTIANNLLELNLGEIISETASDFGWSIGEDVFVYFSGPIGDILKGLFQLGSLENLIIQHVEYVNSYKAGSIYIQNQGGGVRTLQEITVECKKEFSDDTSLNVYKIDFNSDILNALKVTSPDIYNKIQSGISYTYNISLIKDGREVQPNQEVSVYIPIPKELKMLAYMKLAKVYRLEDDGSLTEMDTKLKNDCFEFQTTHFSIYILTEDIYSKGKSIVLISCIALIACLFFTCCISLIKSMKKQRCSTCGMIIKTKGNFCTKCGSPLCKKNKISKKKIIILNIILFILIGVLGYFIYIWKFSGERKNRNEGFEVQIDDSDNTKLERNEPLTLDTDKSQEDQQEVLDDKTENAEQMETDDFTIQESIDEKISHIRSVYQDIVTSMQENAYSRIDFTEALSGYSDGENVRCIIKPSQSEKELYKKYYYYEGNNLIFAYYEGVDAHRFYFDDNKLIRWRYSSDASIPDSAVNYEEETEELINWQEQVYADAMKAKEIVNRLYENGYILEGSDCRIMDSSELDGLTAEQCNLAKSEIYARHGYIFESDEIRNYFSQFSWYNPSIYPEDFKDSLFNEYEIYNRDLVINYEKLMSGKI